MAVRFLLLLFLTLVPGQSLLAQSHPEWTTNHIPFHIVGNIYYVGSNDLAAYLIATPQGHILLNTNMASSVPQICQNIEALGFKLTDIKLLLNSQAHFDHAGGFAELKRRTQAKLAIMEADVAAVESGGRTDFLYFNDPDAQFPPAKVDRVLHDGDQVVIGHIALTAHLTAGHTKGDTTWTLEIPDAGHSYHIVIFGGAGVNPGSNLINDTRYPQQAADFVRTFRTLRALPCDVFLGAHGVYFGLLEKYQHLQANSLNPFIDPAGYQAYIANREQAFLAELAHQKTAHQNESLPEK